MKKLSLMLVSLIIYSGCSSTPKPSSPESVTIMAYNMENLFDTQQDADREDYTFLPASLKQTQAHKLICAKMTSHRDDCLNLDWNESVLDKKMARLAAVVLSVNGGRGPDLMMVEEVENLNVLKQLNDKHLKKAGYQSVVLIEGPDLRGIDVGMLSRFPLSGEAKLHHIPFVPKSEDDKVWMARSRGILEATFVLPDGQKLTAFALHFPSQANPGYWREQAIDFLNQLKNQVPKENLVVAGGDFNISHEEDLRAGFFRERLGKEWLISHYIGCKDCDGTHNYRGSWSFLDALLFSPSMGIKGQAKWQVLPQTVQVPVFSRYQTTPFNTPARFSENKPAGVSDHYPIMVEIAPRKE